MARRDSCKAEAIGIESKATMTAYTDGSTVPLPIQDSGWGWVIQIPGAKEGLYRKGHGKLKGLQDNYTAETMGLLQVLIETHPATGLHICIDNQGVVKRWEKDMRADPRARSKGSARAAWNRIEHIRQEREKAGGITKVSWIHSHVERDTKEGQNNREETETKGDEKKRKIKGRPSLFP